MSQLSICDVSAESSQSSGTSSRMMHAVAAIVRAHLSASDHLRQVISDSAQSL